MTQKFPFLLSLKLAKASLPSIRKYSKGFMFIYKKQYKIDPYDLFSLHIGTEVLSHES